MNKATAALAILALLLGASLMATATTPQAGVPAPNWEYTTLTTTSKVRLAERLNVMGKQGWELVGEIHNVDTAEVVFKRRLP
jgi:hypothetical protein